MLNTEHNRQLKKSFAQSDRISFNMFLLSFSTTFKIIYFVFAEKSCNGAYINIEKAKFIHFLSAVSLGGLDVTNFPKMLNLRNFKKNHDIS